MTRQYTSLEEKKHRLDALGPIPRDLAANLSDWFKVELTYTSNAIEGNTLSRVDTALVIEKGLTVAGKTIREHLEAINHAQAFDWILTQSKSPTLEISQSLILDLHRLILQKIDDTNAGRFRTVPVRIAGSQVIMPNAVKIPTLLNEFTTWIQDSKGHPVKIAVEAHYRLVTIHPFVDGNGRTARLLMNLILMHAGYPPAVVRKEDRKQYISSIEKAQLGGSLSGYTMMMLEAVDRSLDMYLASMGQKAQETVLQKKNLLKIGELSKLTGENVPTIRHWTKEELLHVSEYSASGYQLYDQEQISTAKKIRRLQDTKRLTLQEIKKELEKE